MTPQEFFARRTAIVDSGRWSELIGEYADDAIVHQPFALPQPITLRGRAEIEKHLRQGEAAPFSMQVRNVLVHETKDPEVFIAEYDYEITADGTGKRATVANIQLFRVRDGLIVESHDYHDHAAIGRLLGR
jgi:ketosteroid isomerase-like protein